MFCHNCGKQIPDATKFCHYCGAAQDVAQSAPLSAAPPPVQQVPPQPAAPPPIQQVPPQPTAPPPVQQVPPQPVVPPPIQQVPPQPAVRQEQEHERVLLGIFGALLCSLAGIVVMVLLFILPSLTGISIPYLPSLSGTVMIAFTALGYTLFSKAMSGKGVVFSVLITIAMIYVGNRLWYADLLRKVNNPFTPLTDDLWYFLHLPLLPSMAKSYHKGLALKYAFAALGMIFLVIILFMGKRKAKKK